MHVSTEYKSALFNLKDVAVHKSQWRSSTSWLKFQEYRLNDQQLI